MFEGFFFLVLFLVVHHPTLGGGMILSNSHMAMDTHKYLAASGNTVVSTCRRKGKGIVFEVPCLLLSCCCFNLRDVCPDLMILRYFEAMFKCFTFSPTFCCF